jgi:hypothetical protein
MSWRWLKHHRVEVGSQHVGVPGGAAGVCHPALWWAGEARRSHMSWQGREWRRPRQGRQRRRRSWHRRRRMWPRQHGWPCIESLWTMWSRRTWRDAWWAGPVRLESTKSRLPGQHWRGRVGCPTQGVVGSIGPGPPPPFFLPPCLFGLRPPPVPPELGDGGIGG